MRFGGLTYEGLCGMRFDPPGHYEALYKSAPFSISLHFTPLQPNLKNISKIYLWINLWITMLSNRYQTRNIKPLPVDNFIFRGIKPASNLISGICLAYKAIWHIWTIWLSVYMGCITTRGNGVLFAFPAKIGYA
jgi:hypothetical protein